MKSTGMIIIQLMMSKKKDFRLEPKEKLLAYTNDSAKEAHEIFNVYEIFEKSDGTLEFKKLSI